MLDLSSHAVTTVSPVIYMEQLSASISFPPLMHGQMAHMKQLSQHTNVTPITLALLYCP